ncbi:MAG: hypothetical protein K2W95_18015 [Candidatus Obscuribacterales bacterium]|nr:hypothetical protein [Candidatus Obscuribacterales bacterium]
MFDGAITYRRRTIDCPANEWTVIIKTCCIHIPATFKVGFTAESGTIEGKFEKQGGLMFFPIGAPVTGPISQSMNFERSIWNDYFCIKIRPASNLKADVRML